jgi:hypothetical protein
MSNFSQTYKTFSESLLKANKELIAQWSQDAGDPELMESCKMLMAAAGQK